MEGPEVRWSLAALGAAVGFYVSLFWLGRLGRVYPLPLTATEATGLTLLGLALGAVFGFRVGPGLLRAVGVGWQGVQRRLAAMPAASVLAGILGIVLGLLVAFLLSPELSRLFWLARVAATLVLAWLGWAVLAQRGGDWRRVWAGGRESTPALADRAEGEAALDVRPKVLDTSAIIDGRVSDLYRTGFLEGPLVAPSYVLDELRHLADSPEDTRRARGRHGLDVLTQLQKDFPAAVRIETHDPDPALEVDMKLLRLAAAVGGVVVTTDFNLNKVAGLQGVPVLNVNDLANALRPRYLYGEEMVVRIVGAGKQPGQGVGYLEDGTMVLVEGARRCIGEEVGITVTNFIQNDKGRMIFGRMRTLEPSV